ncbi:MAG: hypothetical protein JWQ21_2374 [Herminiimonas sp.]|nr:hypothetical protein [Herminiimonas sp.]
MRTFKAWPAVIVCVAAAFAIPLQAAAQQPSKDVPPPKLEKLEEGDAPAVTIPGSAADRQITEKREQGKVTSVKVKSGNSTYYLKPNTPAGSAVPGDAQSDTMRPAQWQVLEFDLNRVPDPKKAAEQTDVLPPPESAAAPANKK